MWLFPADVKSPRGRNVASYLKRLGVVWIRFLLWWSIVLCCTIWQHSGNGQHLNKSGALVDAEHVQTAVSMGNHCDSSHQSGSDDLTGNRKVFGSRPGRGISDIQRSQLFLRRSGFLTGMTVSMSSAMSPYSTAVSYWCFVERTVSMLRVLFYPVEAVCFTEMSVMIYQSKRSHIPEHSNFLNFSFLLYYMRFWCFRKVKIITVIFWLDNV